MIVPSQWNNHSCIPSFLYSNNQYLFHLLNYDNSKKYIGRFEVQNLYRFKGLSRKYLTLGFDVDLLTSKVHPHNGLVKKQDLIREKILLYLFENKGMSYSEIVDYLNDLKIKPVKTDKWTNKNIGMFFFKYRKRFLIRNINKITHSSKLYFYIKPTLIYDEIKIDRKLIYQNILIESDR